MPFYYRGFNLEADTFNVAKALGIRDADTNTLHPYAGGPTPSHIQHNGQTRLPYSFITPFLAHLVKDEPQDAVAWKRFGIEWIGEQWPELSASATAWFDCGTPGAKYMLAGVIALDTNGQNVSLKFVTSDGGATQTMGPFNTIAGQKTPQPMAFTTPLVAHQLQITPSAPCRIWIDGAEWIFDAWPERLLESSPWVNCGRTGAKYIRRVTVPVETNGVVAAVQIKSSDGTLQALSTTTAVNVKTPVAFDFAEPFIAHELQYVPVPNNPMRIWWQEAVYEYEEWPELTQAEGPWQNFGTNKAKYLRVLRVPVDTNGRPMSLPFTTAEGDTRTPLSVVTTPGAKTVVSFAFAVPLIGHDFKNLSPDTPARIWWAEAQPDFEEWPELVAAAGPWMNFGTNNPKYLRAIRVVMDTNGAEVSIPLLSSDIGAVATLTATTQAGVKTPVPFPLAVPLIGHEFQLGIPTGPVRIWFEEIQPDFDEWPERIAEASGWMSILPGNAAAFLQGLVVPVEANGAVPILQVQTDTGLLIALSSPLVSAPAANVKTPIPFALSTPVVCHQVQLIAQNPCRTWKSEIRWIAQPTPELAYTWKTQSTGHGLRGYQFVGRIEAAYSSTQPVTLALAAFDGTSPQTITLPSTGGAYQKILLTPSFNKFMLLAYSAISSAPFQIFVNDWTVWLGMWGRTGGLIPYRSMGGLFGDKAEI